jgi:hypothetical protein
MPQLLLPAMSDAPTTLLSARDPAWTAAWAELEVAVGALDASRVGTATTEWLHCAGNVVQHLPIEQHSDDLSKQDQKLVWDEMTLFMQLAKRLTAATLLPGALERATACVTEMCRALYPKFNNMQNEYFPRWDDDGMRGKDWCSQEIVGAAVPVLHLHLARYAAYSGWCYRFDSVCSGAVNLGAGDTTPRVLQRVLLLIAGLCRFEAVDSEWHTLAYHATTLGGLCESFKDTEELLEMLSGQYDGDGWEAMPDPMDDAPGDMVRQMLVARRAGRLVRPRLSAAQVDQLTYLAGKMYIETAKKAYYKSLWRKWWLLWSATSRWIQYVGEWQGGVGGTVGAAAISAFDVDMGDAAAA